MSNCATESADRDLARNPVLWSVPTTDPDDFTFPESLLAGDFCLTTDGKFYFYTGSDWGRLRPGN